MDRRAWWATVHGVAKSRTRLTDWKSTTNRLLLSSLGDTMYSRARNHSLKWGMNQLLLWSIFLFSCGTLEDWNNFRIQWSSSPLVESEGRQCKRGERVMQEESRDPLNHRKKAFASIIEESALILTSLSHPKEQQWRMKRRSQSKNSTQLWMWLVMEVKSDAVKSNIA